ncbi:hypothetical protein A2331_06395 [Candidatus Falkowbacteria bacterium RIFOXYB2_FULL_34_18]|uniref:Glycosyltransferase 2-like domain-containing protein n=1 Tax=Candidatus Falkowbacteria bacterium RIFOXYD2_FULL_34_120 TaxID=1798007 RepID=A0A1F5TQ75_9BACT|nr:MAG: hypothetical protein A2331_06395 [Candidatus Falkowbacteria bacterium RIFOXYB2_FULL_34_18]OGF29398.1 MAG: hypothetical protein A2500_06485 [Candidatus Falkowbacteria bacterium RIFOXYC12_FULL_34_55]OGF36607.1 MAG: hypothetical protein A2466_06820 [Candidatus Falkowbacteria bacterium RIFOXYC2_FULL_34_220]OGF38825.1 MAG: hypothetical protein A2515_03265 [Candidatus Falkowbacteria bacterium RIFOXYD12_FULL_34_57]OGF41070.1 MAG: hypothetical protein A2531_03230 [Candidatus Falkowbacteria bact
MVGIIIINYKDYANRFLADCRDSLRTQSFQEEKVRFYIVDNASSKESRNSLKDNFQEAVILPRSDGNYAAANKLGVETALGDGCNYIVIANMDTVFDKNWLRELILAVDSDDRIGVVQSKMLLYPKIEEEKKHPKINSIGNVIHFLGFGFTSGYKEADREIGGLPEISGYASGCSFIIKKEVLERIGNYDEEYYMYHDDIEMSWRVKLAGYKIVLAPKSIMYHKYEFSRSVRMLYYMERNRNLIMFHYYRLPTLLLILPMMMVMEAGMILYSIPGKWFLTKMKAIGYFLRPVTWMKITRKRRKINALRRVTDREIIKNFASRIIFQEIENPVLKYIANPIMDLYWQMVKYIIVW